MKTYLYQNAREKFTVTILLSLILIGVAEAGNQNPCDPCASQTTMSAAPPTKGIDPAVPAISFNNDRTQLSNKELIEQYPGSIESRIVVIISNMMAIFVTISLLFLFMQFMVSNSQRH